MPLGPKLNGTLRAFIASQPMFSVGTAAQTRRVNVSPKGANTLRILVDRRIVWLNLSGSGNETAGHLQASNRKTLMVCAFDGAALILRVYGEAQVLHPRDAGCAIVAALFPAMAGSRQIFGMTIDSVQTSCRTGVPRRAFAAQPAAEKLVPYYADLGTDGVEAYWRKKNTQTIDGFETGLFED